MSPLKRDHFKKEMESSSNFFFSGDMFVCEITGGYSLIIIPISGDKTLLITGRDPLGGILVTFQDLR